MKEEKIYNREDVYEMEQMFWIPGARRAAEKRHGFDAEADLSENVKKYEKEPCRPCDKARSLKLLKDFSGLYFRDFWLSPTDKYFPAIAEGTLKLCEKKYPHEKAVRYAKELVKSIDKKEAARAFLYGVAHNKPEYIGALPCLYYAESLPEHGFEPYYVGIFGTEQDKKIFDNDTCNICNYCVREKHDKDAFYSVNSKMNLMYFRGCPPLFITLNSAILYLEEYKRLPSPEYAEEDRETFFRLLGFIEKQPENSTPSKLRDAIKKSGIINTTKDRLSSILDALGYLNILHSPTSGGYAVEHTTEREMESPDAIKTDFAFPVNLWKGKYGVDRESADKIFGDL